MQKKFSKLLQFEFKLLKFFLNEEKKLKPDSKRILMNILVSGGRDSICLLHAAATVLYSKLFSSQRLFTLIVTHINHKKRAEESNRDANFVAHTCLKLGIEFFQFNLPQAPLSTNFQNYAREMRQTFALNLCKELSHKNLYDEFFILTAHHADDHVESVLMHLIRGMGTKGLEGFYGAQKPYFLKPFIEVSTDEIEQYVEKKHILFCTDSSNLSDDYERNFVRHHIIPKIKMINPKYDKNILGFSKKIKELNKQNTRTVTGNLVLLPTTSASELYEFFQNQSKVHKDFISENVIKNILHEACLLRNSNLQSKTVRMKKNILLTLVKNHQSKSQIVINIC